MPTNKVSRAQSEPLNAEDAALSALYGRVEELANVLDQEEAAPSPFAQQLGGLLSCLETDSGLTGLLDALPGLLGSGLVLHSAFSRMFPQASRPVISSVPYKPSPDVTPREQEVLRELAKGHSRKQIAHHLGRREHTIKKHLESLRVKLEAESQHELLIKAQAYGQMSFDLIDFLGKAATRKDLDLQGLSYFLMETLEGPSLANNPLLGRLSELGLLLFVVSILAAGEKESRLDYSRRGQRGQVLEYTPEGRFVRVLMKGLNTPEGLAIAPMAGGKQGFPPGSLYVLDNSKEVTLHDGVIHRLSPEGHLEQSFTGGTHFSTHLTTAMALTFSKQGTLLALVGGRTNAILEFTAGGRKVRRFAELIPRCQALAADAHGRVYAIGGTPRRRQLRMYDALGNVLHQLDLDMQSTYSCMTVDPTGRIYLANYVKGCIEGFTISGQRFSAFGQKTFSSPARMAFSPQGHLYVTEKDSPLVDVFAPPHDAPVFSFPLPANFEVLALAFHPNGNLYLSGVPTSD